MELSQLPRIRKVWIVILGLTAILLTIVYFNLVPSYQVEIAIGVLASLALALIFSGLDMVDEFFYENQNRARHVSEYIKSLITALSASLMFLVFREVKGENILEVSFWFSLSPIIFFGSFFFVLGGYAYIEASKMQERRINKDKAR